MNNCIGKGTVSTCISAKRQRQAYPAPVPQAEPSALNELPHALKALVAGRLDSTSNKALRLTNHSFHQVGAERLTKLAIPATELGNLEDVLRGLPYVRTVTITGLDDAGQAQLAAMPQATRDRITHIRAAAGATDAGLTPLQGLTQLQSLDLAWCHNITDAGLAPLRGVLRNCHVSH